MIGRRRHPVACSLPRACVVPGRAGTLRVAAIRFPRISNATDLDALAAEPGLDVYATTSPSDVQSADLVVLPGSRSTLSDLDWMRDLGLADALTARAAVGGPIALVEDGDVIAIDAVAGTIDLIVDDAVLATRRAAWQPRAHDYQSGALWRYAQNVGPAAKGALTHPGAAKETHIYADI